MSQNGNPIPVLFGTETGNAEFCAQTLARELCEIGFAAAAVDMVEYSVSKLRHDSVAFFVTSTTGDGETPDNALELLGELQGGAHLPNLLFAVCGLGDRSYEFFAQCGKEFDAALARTGAQRILPRTDLDADFEDDFMEFVRNIQDWLLQG